jgi:hypothetical protein
MTTSKMQPLSNTVLGLNTAAASLLQQGSFHEADVIFHQALQQFTSSITSTVSLSKRRFAINVLPVPVNKEVSALEESFSPDNTFVLYDKSFLFGLVSNHDYTNEVDTDTLKLQLSAILLYNWGVANHCVAISTGSTTHLQRSFKIYSRAFAVLNQRGADMDFNDSTTLLLLALYNNMGHCCSHLSEPESAQKCHEYIRSISVRAKRSQQQGFRSEYEIFDTSNLFLNQTGGGQCSSCLHFAAAA